VLIRTTSPAEQIAEQLRADIDAGRLKPGDQLPSDQTLASQFGVSKPTVTKARAMLVALRLVESRAGAPSTVRDTSHDGVLASDRVRRARHTGRIYPEGHYARILSASVQPAPHEVASALGLEVGAPTIARQRVTYATDGEPLAESVSYFPGELADTCPALLETERILTGTTVYIEQQTGRRAATETTAAWCQPADPDTRLALPDGAYVLVVSTATCDQAGAVIAYEVETHPPVARFGFDPIEI